jgi:DNA-binding CsgD family transcriptional regulator
MPLDTPPVVGRARLLQDVRRRVQEGVGSVLTGPSGSGGSRMVAEVATVLRRAGIVVARLPNVAAAAPDHAFLSLLDHDAAARVEAAEGRCRTALLREALTARGLQVLVVDDVAEVGDAPAQLLEQLARSGTTLVANATGRRPIPAALESLVPDGLLVVTPLPGLSDTEVGALAEHVLLDPVDAELAHALADVSGGRPATVLEVVRDAVGNRSIVHTDGLWHLAGVLPAPRSVRAEVRDLLAALPPDQRAWIAAVAVAGRLAADLAPRIAGPTAAAGAEEAGWTEHHEPTGTVHVATMPARTAVIDSLDLRARIAVLRRLIDAVETLPRERTERERVDLLRWRIELGEPIDPEEALDLALLPAVDRETQELLLRAAVEAGGSRANAELADHLRRTRRPGEALALVRAALPGAATPEERVQLVRVEAMTTGVVERRAAEAIAALDEYSAEFGAATDLLAVRSALLLLLARPEEAIETAARVLADPDRSAYADAFGELQTSLALRELGRVDESLVAADRYAADAMRERAFTDGGALARWLPHDNRVAAALELDGPDAAVTALHRAAAAERHPSHRPLFAYTLGIIRTQQADARTAVDLLRDADGGAGAWRDGWRPRILAELAVAQTLAGATGDAGVTLDRIARLGVPPVHLGRVDLARAQLAAARGRADEAIGIARGVAERGRTTGLRLDAFDGEFAALRYGDADAAARLLALGPDPAGEGRVAQRQYAAAIRSGEPADLHAAALALWSVGQRLHALEAAAAATDAGSTDTEQRLVLWLAKVPDGQLPIRASGRPIGLTARERQVAALAADGHSDRSIAAQLGITLRTAQTHLARAFAKLGVHRRADLRGLVDQ